MLIRQSLQRQLCICFSHSSRRSTKEKGKRKCIASSLWCCLMGVKKGQGRSGEAWLMKARMAEEVPLGHIFFSPGMDLAKFDSAEELQTLSRSTKMRLTCRRVIQCRWMLFPRCFPPASRGHRGERGRGLRSPVASLVSLISNRIFSGR